MWYPSIPKIFNRMKITAFTFIFICGFLYSESLHSQFAPVGVLPMQYNPSFAGSAGNIRLVSNFSYGFRDYGDSDNRNETGASFSFDTFVPKIRSGIGIKSTGFLGTNQRGSENYKNNYGSISFIAAPKFSVKGKFTISPSFQFSYTEVYHEYTYGSDYLKINGFSGNAGILVNTSNYYFGFSIRVFQSEVPEQIHKEKLVSSFQFGYCFQKSENSRFSFTPQLAIPIVVYSDYDFQKPEYTLGFRYDHYLFGAYNYDEWYPSGFQLGWQKNGWRIMFCNVIKLGLGSHYPGYEGDLSLRYIFNQDKKSKHIIDSYY